jgi:CBS-domain-containing membrane protein
MSDMKSTSTAGTGNTSAMIQKPCLKKFLNGQNISHLLSALTPAPTTTTTTTPLKKSVIKVLSTDSVEHAVELMAKHNISSVPVEDHQIKGRFIGFLTLEHIMYATVFNPIFSTYNTDAKLAELPKTHSETIFDQLFDMEAYQKPVSSLIPTQSQSQSQSQSPSQSQSHQPIHVLDAKQSTLADLMKQLVNGQGRRALVRVHDEKQQEEHITIISRSDVLRFIMLRSTHEDLKGVLTGSVLEHMHAMNADTAGTADTADTADVKSCITMDCTQNAVTGFRCMIREELSVLPVVNAAQDGRIVAALSPKHLSGLTKDTFHRIILNVMEFLKMEHIQQPQQQQQQEQELVVEEQEEATLPPMCTKHTSLLDLLGLFVNSSVRHVFVVNNMQQKKPITAISLDDVLATLYASSTSNNSNNNNTSSATVEIEEEEEEEEEEE